MGSSDPILILTASAGAGHRVAATALQQAFRARQPELDAQVHDVLDKTNPIFRAIYARGYLSLVNRAPDAMGWLYRITDRSDGYANSGLRSTFQNLNVRAVARFIVRSRPRLIINTHFLPAEIVANLRRSGRLRCPQAIVTTDYETHRIWVQQPAERYYTASEIGKAHLLRLGVPDDRIRFSGVPVRQSFKTTESVAQARGQLELDRQRPVVLLLCGGFGVGPAERLLSELLRELRDVQIVAIVGNNTQLRTRLERLTGPDGRAARIIGYTEQIDRWMRAASLAVTKPGGLTTAESLACRLPLVIMNPIPGPEERNSDFVLENGAAIRVNHIRTLAFRIRTLLADGRRLAAMRRKAAALARPDAADEIVADVLELAGESGTNLASEL